MNTNLWSPNYCRKKGRSNKALIGNCIDSARAALIWPAYNLFITIFSETVFVYISSGSRAAQVKRKEVIVYLEIKQVQKLFTSWIVIQFLRLVGVSGGIFLNQYLKCLCIQFVWLDDKWMGQFSLYSGFDKWVYVMSTYLPVTSTH